jgi:hypothetical protein
VLAVARAVLLQDGRLAGVAAVPSSPGLARWTAERAA